MAAHLNQELKDRYDSQHDSWKIMVEAGKIDNLNPPTVPLGYDVVKAPSGFSYPEMGITPVCPPRKDIPADYSKPAVQVIPEPDHIRQAPAGDTVAVGTIITDQNGVKWQKQRSVTPFGTAYFYVRIA